MLTLIDVGQIYWRNWFATLDLVRAHEMTMDVAIDYARQGECILCCDSPRSLRKEWFPEYKANRKEKDQRAIDGLLFLQEQAKGRMPIALCDGFEADDMIAALVKQAFPDEVRIIGSEKDLFCLISDRVHLVGKGGRIDEGDCFEKFSVLPRQMHDWLTMVGDDSDNIPGCPNCGPQRAADLLGRFDTLSLVMTASDADILSIHGVGKKTLESLRQWDPSMSRSLTRLLDEAPIDLFELQTYRKP